MKRFAIAAFIFYGYAVCGQITDFRHTNFSKADSIAERYAAHSLIDLKTLAGKLTESLPTEQEKFRAIYKWVCSNIGVDYELLTLNKRKRAELEGEELIRWNQQFNGVIFKTLLNEKKTICTGYAYLIKALAVHAGFQCEIITGYAKQAGIDPNSPGQLNHSWSEIRINNKWYVCDATWSAGVFNLTTNKFTKKYNNLFFLTEPELFFQTHYAIDDRQHHVVIGR